MTYSSTSDLENLRTARTFFWSIVVLFSTLVVLVAFQHWQHFALTAVIERAIHIRPEPNSAALISPLAGNDVYRIRHLSFHNCDWLTDGGMSQLGRLRDLRRLSLHRTSITDQSAAAFGKLDRLQTLSLQGTTTSDATLQHVGRLPALESLNIGHTKVTNDGFQYLQAASKLAYLNTEGLELSANGMTHLGNVKSLREIRLTATAGFAWSDMPDLRRFQVRLECVDGDIELKNMPALERVVIDVDTRDRSSNAVVSISNAPNLTSLYVLGANVKIDGAPELRELLVYGNDAKSTGQIPTVVVGDDVPPLATANLEDVAVSVTTWRILPNPAVSVN